MERENLEILKEQNPFSSLHEIICDLILQDIISFRLQPGERLVEKTIADIFQVSRSPVRTAMEVLVERGYLTQNQRYFYVKDFCEKEYSELRQLSNLLEPYAAGEAARKITAKQLDFLYEMAYSLQRLYHTVTHQTLSDSFMPLMDVEYKFHSSLVDFAGSSVLSKIYEEYRYRIMYYRSYILQNPPREVLDTLADDHILICDTLKLRDPDMAIAVLKRHLSISKQVIEESHVLDHVGNGIT